MESNGGAPRAQEASVANPKTLALAAMLALPVLAQQTPFQKTHPRRAEVNKRLDNQNNRIDQGLKNGKLTQAQAAQLHKEDQGIRKEERNMAAKDGGHITRQDQKKLNRQENKVSKQIHAAKKH
jgi:hypothetical protein